jgi:hypothetical protein
VIASSLPCPNKKSFGHFSGFFGIEHNSFTGSIPEVMGTLKDLARVSFHSNMLTGLVPQSLGSLQKLNSVTFDRNPQLHGTMPDKVCDLRGDGGLSLLVVDCREDFSSSSGVSCPIDCCTSCRDSEGKLSSYQV